MYEIIKLDDKKIWNDFLDEVQPQSFLQDFEWGEIKKSLGREIIRLGIYKNNDSLESNLSPLKSTPSPSRSDLIGVCQIIGHQAKRGNFLLIPHGPVINKQLFLGNCMPAHSSGEPQPLFSVILEIINFLKSQNYHKKYTFLRLNSSIPLDSVDISGLQKIGFQPAPIFTVSENMWVKNLQKNESGLLEEMTSTHRKLIADAIKKPYLEITSTNDTNKIDGFWKIYQELAKRKEFTPYSYNLIKKEFEIFAQSNKAKLYIGRVEGKIVSSALIIYSHKIAFYHHGASLTLKEPVNHKLHWQIMLDAKNNNCEYYNFWGITLSENQAHPWRGLTQFKKGFGGELLKFIPAMDYAFSKKYWVNFAIEKFRRKIKGL